MENHIQKINESYNAYSASLAREADAKAEIVRLGEHITSAINGPGDPVKIGQEVAPFTVEKQVHEIRLPRLNRDITAARREFLENVQGIANYWISELQTILNQKVIARGKFVLGVLNDQFGIPEEATRGIRLVAAYTGDKLQPVRNVIEALQSIVQNIGLGHDPSPGNISSLIERAAAWSADPEFRTTP